jgi:general secretion pathway protein K
MTAREAQSERGIAIVAAMWASALIAIIILSVLQIVRADARVGRGREDVAVLGSVADAAVNITILSLLGPLAQQPAVNAVPFAVQFAGYSARVSVQDETGKIDLNMANDTSLQQLLLSVGLDAGQSKELARRIGAWRGTGDAEQSGGTAQHRQLFESVEELQQIAGISAELYRRMVPLVTVYSQAAFVDPTYASLDVLNVFRAIDPTADRVWRRRQEERAGLTPPQGSPGVALGHAFTITAQVEGAASARVIRTATVRLTGQTKDPVLIYRWN